MMELINKIGLKMESEGYNRFEVQTILCLIIENGRVFGGITK